MESDYLEDRQEWYDTERLQQLLCHYAGGNYVEILAAINSKESLQAQLDQIATTEKHCILPLNVNALTKELGQDTNHWVGLYITHNGIDASSGTKRVIVDYVDPMGHAINPGLKNHMEECLASLLLSAEIRETLLGKPIQYAKQVSSIELQGNTDDCGPMLVYIMTCLSRSLDGSLPKFTNEITSHSFGIFLRESFDRGDVFEAIYSKALPPFIQGLSGLERAASQISLGNKDDFEIFVDSDDEKDRSAVDHNLWQESFNQIVKKILDAKNSSYRLLEATYVEVEMTKKEKGNLNKNKLNIESFKIFLGQVVSWFSDYISYHIIRPIYEYKKTSYIKKCDQKVAMLLNPILEDGSFLFQATEFMKIFRPVVEFDKSIFTSRPQNSQEREKRIEKIKSTLEGIKLQNGKLLEFLSDRFISKHDHKTLTFSNSTEFLALTQLLSRLLQTEYEQKAMKYGCLFDFETGGYDIAGIDASEIHFFMNAETAKFQTEVFPGKSYPEIIGRLGRNLSGLYTYIKDLINGFESEIKWENPENQIWANNYLVIFFIEMMRSNTSVITLPIFLQYLQIDSNVEALQETLLSIKQLKIPNKRPRQEQETETREAREDASSLNAQKVKQKQLEEIQKFFPIAMEHAVSASRGVAELKLSPYPHRQDYGFAESKSHADILLSNIAFSVFRYNDHFKIISFCLEIVTFRIDVIGQFSSYDELELGSLEPLHNQVVLMESIISSYNDMDLKQYFNQLKGALERQQQIGGRTVDILRIIVENVDSISNLFFQDKNFLRELLKQFKLDMQELFQSFYCIDLLEQCPGIDSIITYQEEETTSLVGEE